MDGFPVVPASAAMVSDFADISSTYDAGIDDPYPLFRQAREATPVREGDILADFGVPSQADFANCGRKVFTLFRYDDVARVLRDSENFDSSLLQDGLGNYLDGVLLSAINGSEHTRLRAMMLQCFTPAFLKLWRGRVVEPVIRERFFAPLAERGRAELMTDVALMFPLRVIYEIIGFPLDPDMIEQFSGWALQVLAGPQRDPARAQASGMRAVAAAQALYDNILPIVAARRAAGAEGDDLIAFLLRTGSDGTRLSDAEIANLIRGLLPAAGETTTRSFGNLMVLLLQRPALMEQLRQDRSLVPKVITESLRFEPTTTFLARLAIRDVEIRGVPIPAGAAVSLATGSANRDEAMFADGERFDPLRAAKPMLTFGAGPHTCLGMAIARMELDCALNAVLDLMPGLRADPEHRFPVISGIQLRGPAEVHVAW